MESVKVSVIVPVYNGEKYIRQSLDSIVGQTLSEIEIILVDDGSTDGAPEILESYAKADPRVRIFHQQNRYAGAARNLGLEHATGEYVMFWDADDYFELNALELMYTKAKEHEADLCLCDAQDFDDETGTKINHTYLRKPFPEQEVFSIQDFKERIYDFTSTVCWNKMARREFLEKNEIRFQELKHINDFAAVIEMMTFAERIVLVRKKLVHYRVNRQGSLMATYGERSDSIMVAVEGAYEKLSAQGALEDEVIRNSFMDKACALYFFTMSYCSSYEQYLAYYNRMFRDNKLLQSYEPREENTKNIERYLEAKKLSPEDLLYQEYRTFVQRSSERQQVIADLRRTGRKHTKQIESLEEEKRLFLEREKDWNKEKEELEKQISQMQAKVKASEKAEKELKKIKASKSYKAGRLLTWPFRKIKRLFRRS